MTAVVTPVREHVVLADARGSRFSRHQRDRTTWRLVVGSLVALSLMLGFGALVGEQLAERQALVDARGFTVLLGEAFLTPDLAQDLLEGDETALDRFDVLVVDQLIRNTSVRRVKLWSADGKVLYSDDRAEIGKVYAMSDHKLEALRTNKAVEEVSNLEDSDSMRERPLGPQLIEVYVPVRTADGERVLFETYLSYNRVLEQREAVFRTLAGLALVGLVVLASLQLVIGLMNLRWLRRQQREAAEHARASAERDRRLLARNLHDGPVQELVGTAYVVEGARSSIRSGHLDAAEELLTTASSSVRDSVQSLRAGMVELYPRSIHQVGLAQALDDLAQPLRTRGVVVTVEILPSHDIDRALDGEVVEVAHRCVQELLRNVQRHAEAREVAVTVELLPQALVLVVRDDGRGMPAHDVDAEHGHLGLQALADIAGDYRGSLEVWSGLDAGTEVRMELSL